MDGSAVDSVSGTCGAQGCQLGKRGCAYAAKSIVPLGADRYATSATITKSIGRI